VYIVFSGKTSDGGTAKAVSFSGKMALSNMSDTQHEREWCVFDTRARAGKKCEERLRGRRIDVLVPKTRETQQWSDRTTEVEVPLFRNYLFAHVDEKDRLRTLKTNGIIRCVHFHGEPARLHPDTAEQLRKTQAAPDRLSVVDLRPQIWGNGHRHERTIAGTDGGGTRASRTDDRPGTGCVHPAGREGGSAGGLGESGGRPTAVGRQYENQGVS
jgi:hypothetical protein